MNRIEPFFTNWYASLEKYLKDYIYDDTGNLLKTRFIYSTLKRYLRKLLQNKLETYEKIILLPGLRGVGKTTLLAQLYFFEKYTASPKFVQKQKIFKLYVSVDKLKGLGINLIDFYEFLKVQVFPKYPNYKILLLFDEVQYDPNWALFLKLLFDENLRNKDILVIATGSSALLLNTQNQDLVRRSLVHKVLPEKFVEFLKLHKNIKIKTDISRKLQKYLFFSKNAEQVFRRIKELQPSIIEVLSRIPNMQTQNLDFLNKGMFPFSANVSDGIAMDKIREMVLVNIVQKDILQYGNIESEVLSRISDLLYLLANSDSITTGNIAQSLKLSMNTTNKLIDILKKAELLIELKPYARPYAQIRKSSKLLFISPNIRWALLQGFINEHKGKLLEDYIAFLLYKELYKKTLLLHDFSKKGADFVIRYPNNTEIIFEVGFTKNTVIQVNNTLKRTQGRAKYGIIIGSNNLELENNIVKIPLEYALLI